MNKYIRAVGVLSLGAASLAVQNTACAAEGGDKPWKISTGLKGFYDDNIFTRPNGTNKLDSFGFEVSPRLSYAIITESSSLKLSYALSAKYFEKRRQDPWDMAHVITVAASHSVNDRISLNLNEYFAVAQDPEQLSPGGISAVPFRANGDNKSNHADASAKVEVAPLTNVILGYRNDYYNYDDINYQPRLNRVEHNPYVDLTYQLQKNTLVRLGYRYGIVNYDSKINNRDNQSQFVTVGADQTFRPDLSASARVGVQLIDYKNPQQSDSTSPYADASLNYALNEKASLTLGVRHERVSTDVTFAQVGDPSSVQDTESTATYLTLSHNITPLLTGKVNLQYVNSEYIGGSVTVNGKTENKYTVGVTMNYKITENLSAEASYFYDKLTSVTILGRDYTRNRIFLGIRASY